jgi:hypothetical protein
MKSVRSRNALNVIEMSWSEVAAQMGEIYADVIFSYFFDPVMTFPAKSVTMNNFLSVRDKRKLFTDDLFKIGVTKSKCDVIFFISSAP